MNTCMYLLRKAEMGFGSPVTGIKGGWELPDIVAGNQTSVLF